MTYLLDTNVYGSASYRDAISRLRNVVWCSVVVQEILAITPIAKSKQLINEFNERLERGQAVTPEKEDWFEVGKCMFRLLAGINATGTPLSKGEVNLLVRDALIARCAIRADATVITDNVRDFDKIKSVFRSLRFKPASAAFGMRAR